MTRIDLPQEKKVGHLTLLREPRSITAKEFNALTADERLEIVRRARGGHKYNLLLEARDPEVLVRRLPAQELYLLFKELGPEQVPELLELVNTSQFTSFLDLDCWQQDLLDGPSALYWLQLLLEGDEEKIFTTVRELDFELLVLVMKKFFAVVQGPESSDDQEARAAGGGGYEIEYFDAEGAKIIGALLGLLFKRDEPFAVHLLEAVRWEPEAELEETVYQFRTGRLLDLGFPDSFEALAVYAFLDPATFDAARHHREGIIPGEEGVEAPGFLLASARPRDLLAEILAAGVTSGFCWELTYLLNKTMVADRVDVGDALRVQESTEEVFRYLNLALEHLSGGDLAKANRLVDEVYLEALFRLGFSLTLQLQKRASALRGDAIVPYLDGPFRALIEALGQRKPRFFEGIEYQDRGGERPFATLRDLRLAGQWLDRLEVQQQLFERHFPFSLPRPEDIDLSGCFPEDPEDLALSDFFLTALANRILGREFLPEPVPQDEVPALHAKVSSERRLDETLRRETLVWLDSLVEGAGAFGDYCLELWAEEFCALAPDALDPRYVSGLIVRVA